jgi:transcriptional regulator with XRE-family HTH domain
MSLSKALQRVRFERNLNQIYVAKKAKISQTYLSQLETGDKKQPSRKLLNILGKIYDVHPIIFEWYAIEDIDIKTKHKDFFTKLKPSMDALINEFLIKK